jgi:hypothetical protein
MLGDTHGGNIWSPYPCMSEGMGLGGLRDLLVGSGDQVAVLLCTVHVYDLILATCGHDTTIYSKNKHF